MARFKSKNTSPERAFRMLLVRHQIKHVCHPRIPGIPRRSADFRVGKYFVFVNGRHWHDPSGTTKSMAIFWRRKVLKNHERDQDTYRHLLACDYVPVVLWDDAPEEWDGAIKLLAGSAGTPATLPAPSSGEERTSRSRSRAPGRRSRSRPGRTGAGRVQAERGSASP